MPNNKKKIVFDEDARKGMKAGVDILARAVSMTLGPRGRAVVVEKAFGAPQVTFDGVTVAKEVKLEDPYESLGAELVKQAADKTNDNVGDGTTTSTVLAHAMINAGESYVQSRGINVIKLAEALKEEAKTVIADLEGQAVKVETTKQIEEVATLSAKDAKVGAMIAEVMEKAGKDGVITVDDSNTSENYYEMVEGLSFDRGYVSHYFITNQDKLEAVIDKPYVLVTDKKISNVQEILPMLESIMKTGRKELVIVADEIDGEALATLIVNKLRGIFNVLAVKAPGFGDNKKAMLEDIATVTGAVFISGELGMKFENVTTDQLGQAVKVVATRDLTTVVGGNGKQEEISRRVESLKNQIEQTDSAYEKEKLQERVGKLSGGVTVIKIGAPTESAQKELKQRVEDAVAATKAAMDEGIVPGGGIALYNVAKKYHKKLVSSAGDPRGEVGQAANMIVAEALTAPFKMIVENSGEKFEDILKNIETENPWHGFNASTNEVTDLKEAGIIDPLKVSKTAFTNAVSVAANYLTIGAALVSVPEESEEGGPVPGGF